jgi:hypothetical protein
VATKAKPSGTTFRVRIEGLAELAKIPGGLERGQRILLERGTGRIRDEIRRKAPGGPTGRAGRAVQSRVISPSKAVVASIGFDGAKALERGAFIRSKRGPGTAIRFEVGGQRVFVRHPRGVRIPAFRYFEKGLRPRARFMREAFHDGFHDLRRQPTIGF